MGIITEKKLVKIHRCQRRNPVFVSWLDRLGGRNYWLFHTSQVDTLSTTEGQTFEPYTEDLENSRGQINDLSIFVQPSITCSALIDPEDKEGIKTLYYSLNVEVLTNPDTWETDGPKWKTYRPQKGSFAMGETGVNQWLVQITFETPYINNQTQ
jgi:hypothetical protein